MFISILVLILCNKLRLIRIYAITDDMHVLDKTGMLLKRGTESGLERINTIIFSIKYRI